MTTQSTHLYAPRPRSTEGAALPKGDGAQTRLPWWALALPALAFAALLTLLSAGGADASGTAPAGDLFSRIATALPDLIHHVL